MPRACGDGDGPAHNEWTTSNKCPLFSEMFLFSICDKPDLSNFFVCASEAGISSLFNAVLTLIDAMWLLLLFRFVISSTIFRYYFSAHVRLFPQTRLIVIEQCDKMEIFVPKMLAYNCRELINLPMNNKYWILYIIIFRFHSRWLTVGRRSCQFSEFIYQYF